MYRSIHQAVGVMIRYQERRRSPRSMIPGIGASSGEDPDADALMVLILFCRHNKKNMLTRLLVNRETFKDIRGERDKALAYKTLNRFARALCCRGMLEFQGKKKEPHRSCRTYRQGKCALYEPENT